MQWELFNNRRMKVNVRTLTVLGLLIVCLLNTPAMAQQSEATSGGSAASAPKPPPELEKVKAVSGTWKCEGHHSEIPGCPASPTRSTSTSKAELGGFWYVEHEEGSYCGPYKVLDIEGYDPVKKKFLDYRFYDFGAYEVTTSDSPDGPWSGSYIMNGKESSERFTMTYKNDKEFTMTFEDQVDGQWKKTADSTCRKQ